MQTILLQHRWGAAALSLPAYAAARGIMRVHHAGAEISSKTVVCPRQSPL
ncbi:hypothetical protein H1215_08550 [Anoxybacillus sp. LAT_38]|nr:hypothetical protein [Anoxybacillus sp. LAT_38]MCG6197229.1 hypothetical protein [Anoxybacillus sp. LAT_38]